jgi:hypothetical protein
MSLKVYVGIIASLVLHVPKRSAGYGVGFKDWEDSGTLFATMHCSKTGVPMSPLSPICRPNGLASGDDRSGYLTGLGNASLFAEVITVDASRLPHYALY